MSVARPVAAIAPCPSASQLAVGVLPLCESPRSYRPRVPPTRKGLLQVAWDVPLIFRRGQIAYPSLVDWAFNQVRRAHTCQSLCCWAKGQPPVEMLKRDEGVCFLAGISGAFR